MRVSEHANYLLNEYGRLQFDYAAYCKPYGESLRNEARNNLEEYIADLEAEKCVLEDQQREAKNILIDKRLHIDSLYEEGYKLQKRIAELEEKQRWRVVANGELPEEDDEYWVWFDDKFTGYKESGYCDYDKQTGWDNTERVTHWMPLPESPNDTQKDTFVYGKDSKPLPCPFCGEIVKECNDVATPIDVALRKRIAELEGKIDQLTAHSDIERQDDKWIPEVQE